MLPYTHKKISRSRSIKISVKPTGEIVVTSPNYTPKFVINQFVKHHEQWIETQLQKIKNQKKKLKEHENQILLFGKAMNIKTQIDPTKKIGITIDGDFMHVNPIENTQKSVHKAIDRFLKGRAEQYIIETVLIFAKQMNTTYNNVSFKAQSTRWGSCSSKGNLNFNWKLIHTPKEVINYVIIHELAHRTHMNHSVEFWKLVEQFDPEYRIHRGWLKRNGMGLG